MKFSLPFNDIATGAVADTFKTMAAIIVANTAGHRVRVTSLCCGPSDDAPGDRNIAIQLKRIASIAAGTAGTAGTTLTSAQVPKKETASRDTIVTAKLDYSVAPTTYETYPVFEMEFNDRGGFIKEFGDDGPVFEKDQLCGILASPRTAAAVRISGNIEFEEF